MLNEFRELPKRNVMDMAVGILSARFGKVVTSFVNDIIMPPVGNCWGTLILPTGLFCWTGCHTTLERVRRPTRKKARGYPINYGLFINNILDFLIVAFCIFFVVRQMNRIKRILMPVAAEEPTTKTCPECLSTIPVKAKRCAHCTSHA